MTEILTDVRISDVDYRRLMRVLACDKRCVAIDTQPPAPLLDGRVVEVETTWNLPETEALEALSDWGIQPIASRERQSEAR